MPRRIAASTLNATTMDILNVIRQNASLEYQSSVPTITKATDIPHVGEVIYGTPAFANQFLNALVNRIALVRVQSATFNNPYAALKKGYLEFGESVEDIFVKIAKVEYFDPEKADARELKRYIPEVLSAFHVMNWRVMYPVTIQDEDLRQAFLTIDGVQELIARIVDSVYTAANYDEYLLTKYLIIKNVAHGKMFPVSAGATLNAAAKAFRGTSNMLPFMSNKYNAAAVPTTTPRERQVILMDAQFNADFDVDILAASFHMEKADFMGRLYLIDDFTTFDNDRWSVIRAQSDGLESVTADELTIMADVKAVLADENWFQIYDNLSKFTEKYVSSGLYWNYFYHQWKTISASPFANAVVFVSSSATITAPSTITVKVLAKDVSATAHVLTLGTVVGDPDGTVQASEGNFVQTSDMVGDGVAMHPYGAIIVPEAKKATGYVLDYQIGDVHYTSQTTGTAPNEVSNKLTASTAAVGDTLTLTKVSS